MTGRIRVVASRSMPAQSAVAFMRDAVLGFLQRRFAPAISQNALRSRRGQTAAPNSGATPRRVRAALAPPRSAAKRRKIGFGELLAVGTDPRQVAMAVNLRPSVTGDVLDDRQYAALQ